MIGNYKNKKVTVVGLGRSGRAAAEFLKDLGAEVKITEIKKDFELESKIDKLKKKNIRAELGRHSKNFIQEADLIVASPGVSEASLPLVWAREKGIPVTGELELASRFVPCPVIAVTGTNGKTTTASLLGEILKKRHKVEVAGNIGRPLSSLVPKLNKENLLVLEVSSFQLDRIKKFHPYISVILNITPDHLDRYPNFEAYLSSKKRIFLNQGPGDYAIFPAGASYTELLIKESRCSHILFGNDLGLNPGIFYRDSSIWSSSNGSRRKILDGSVLKLKGDHNRQNIMAALAVAVILGETAENISGVIKNFSGLEHRIEIVSKSGGVVFINDSKSTNVDSLIKAVQSFSSIILIAGGRDKGADFTPAGVSIKERVKQIILLGEAKEKLKDLWQNIRPVHLAKDLEEAVILAQDIAQPGDCVLFSPGCSSFDMFRNFEERGKSFKEIVSKLHLTRLTNKPNDD